MKRRGCVALDSGARICCSLVALPVHGRNRERHGPAVARCGGVRRDRGMDMGGGGRESGCACVGCVRTWCSVIITPGIFSGSGRHRPAPPRENERNREPPSEPAGRWRRHLTAAPCSSLLAWAGSNVADTPCPWEFRTMRQSYSASCRARRAVARGTNRTAPHPSTVVDVQKIVAGWPRAVRCGVAHDRRHYVSKNRLYKAELLWPNRRHARGGLGLLLWSILSCCAWLCTLERSSTGHATRCGHRRAGLRHGRLL